MFFVVGSPTANRAAALRVLSVANDIIKSLVPLACRTDNILIRLVAELLGLFCTIGKKVETVNMAELDFSASHSGNACFCFMLRKPTEDRYSIFQ